MKRGSKKSVNLFKKLNFIEKFKNLMLDKIEIRRFFKLAQNHFQIIGDKSYYVQRLYKSLFMK